MTHNIAVIGGDGIGPEVTAEAVGVLRHVADDLVLAPLGGADGALAHVVEEAAPAAGD